jgi:hypothetical protein
MKRFKFCGFNFNEINKEGDERITEFQGKVKNNIN